MLKRINSPLPLYRRWKSVKSVRVGSIVIGDEILKGYVNDTNTHFLAKKCFRAGIKLEQVAILPDDKSVISSYVRDFSEQYDYVITSGGIGPTHDDITFESVGAAFNEDVYVHPILESYVTKFFGKCDPNAPQMKLCTVPKNTKLIETTASGKPFRYPVVTVKNVIVLPGIPQLFERSINNLIGYWETDSDYFSLELHLNCAETDVADILTKAQQMFLDVNIGSYPQWSNNYAKVLIKMDGTNQKQVEQCKSYLTDQISAENVMDTPQNPILKNGEDVYSLSKEDSDLGRKITKSIQVIEKALKDYSPSEISIAFNGGKDCTAVLHLFYAVLAKHNQFQNIKSIYIQSSEKEEIFAEMEDFLKQTNQRYNMDVVQATGDIKKALGEIKNNVPEMKAILMGTRGDDPHGKWVQDFSRTDVDKGWPDFMRVNPILTWSYVDVWNFIRKLQLPYCILYDRGYTSLGSRSSTVPNPDLKNIDSNGKVTYKPAYMLDIGEKERSGRN